MRSYYRRLPVVLLLLAAASRAEGQHVPQLSVQARESDLMKLLALPTADTKQQSSATIDAGATARTCADQLQRMRNYGSVAVLYDREREDLRSHNALGLSETFDYVAPDRYHFVQNSWSGGPSYDFDEWITIADSNYVFTGAWFEGIEKTLVEPPGYDTRRANRGWGLQKYVDVLRGETPASGHAYVIDGRAYYLLTYTFPLSRHPEFPEIGETTTARLQLWIDSTSGFLASADLVPVSVKQGQPSPQEFQQVFLPSDSGIRVDPPAERCSKDRPEMCFVAGALSPHNPK